MTVEYAFLRSDGPDYPMVRREYYFPDVSAVSFPDYDEITHLKPSRF
jgi:hypothetical protein